MRIYIEIYYTKNEMKLQTKSTKLAKAKREERESIIIGRK